MVKKQKTIDLYYKIKQEDGSYRYEIAKSSFDYKPADGIWFVYTNSGSETRECIIPMKRIQDYIPILGLVKHKQKILDIIMDRNGKSGNDIANELIKYLSTKTDKHLQK